MEFLLIIPHFFYCISFCPAFLVSFAGIVLRRASPVRVVLPCPVARPKVCGTGVRTRAPYTFCGKKSTGIDLYIVACAPYINQKTAFGRWGNLRVSRELSYLCAQALPKSPSLIMEQIYRKQIEKSTPLEVGHGHEIIIAKFKFSHVDSFTVSGT